MYNPKNRIRKKLRGNVQIFLLGDAASHVKATTLGGIIPGFKAAEIIAKKLQGKMASFFKLNLELKLHLKIINIINHLSEEEFNQLIDMINNPKVKHILAKTNRDKPLLLVIKLLLTKPSLIKFVNKIF